MRRFRHSPAIRRSRLAMAGLFALGLAGCENSAGPGRQDQIIFVRHYDRPFSSFEMSTSADIYGVNADGSGLVNLTSHPAGYAHLALSPDGKRMAFQSDRAGERSFGDIWVMNTDGTGARKLVDDSGHPSWSPDGTRIAYAHEGPQGYQIYVMNADGGTAVMVSAPAMAVGGSCTRVHLIPLGWLPDGRVSFSRYYCGSGYRFFTVNPDGSGFAETDMNLIEAAWSPDGSRVVFTGGDVGRGRTLFVMNADGSGLRRVSDRGFHQTLPTRPYSPWSRDGKRLVMFTSERNGAKEDDAAYVVEVDGPGIDPLVGVEGQFIGWARSGNRVAFTKWQGDRSDVYVMGIDGKGLVNVTNSTLTESSALWLPAR